jgi:ssDNA-binding Zn-finger/Zn-ribbon topoisomerase 1
MIHGGKCPKCEKTLAHVQIESVTLKQGMTASYMGVSYQCPYCRTLLGAGPDFVAYPGVIAAEVAKKLGR